MKEGFVIITIDQLNRFVKNPYEALILIAILWLFKEFWKRFYEDRSYIDSRIDKTLEAYGILEVSILRHIQIKDQHPWFCEQYGQLFPYLSRSIIDKINNHLEYGDNSQLTDVLNSIKSEEEIIKKEQIQRTTIIKGNGLIEQIEYYFKTSLFPIGSVNNFVYPSVVI